MLTALFLLLAPLSTCDDSAPVSPVAAIEVILAAAPPDERNGTFDTFGPDGTIRKTER